MLGLTGWLEIITAVLKFPEAILRLVLVFKKTPQEQHEALVQAIEAESLKLKKEGRPTWEN